MADAIAPLQSQSPEQTRAIGAEIGKALRTGDVVALVGPLGAGKTQFVKGLAAGAGVADARQVNSPTFVIVNEYDAGPLRFYHLDAWRLRGADDLDALGFDEMQTRGPVVIEWADRVSDILPTDLLTVKIEPTGDQTRALTITAAGQRSDALRSRLAGSAML